MDPTARAYAILGLERGCAPGDLKATYRQLVKRWHPDRFAADPAGQAEASARLREINGAFRIVAEDLGAIRAGGAGMRTPAATESRPRPPERPPEHPPERASGRPLTRDEIDAIVGAVGAESPVDALLRWITLAAPFVGAFLLLLQPRSARPPTTGQTILAFALLALGIALRVRRWARSRRESRSDSA
ncbi:MAG TPA: J domain-containing protein [Vicinamibacteria bacterium]